MKAILLSGGLDSIALAHWQRPQRAVTIDYGQLPAQAEINAASAVCNALEICHDIVRVDCASLGSGQLAGRNILDGAPSPEWWPFRNQLLITLALMRLAGTEVDELMLGTVSEDVVHADGCFAFYDAINAVVAVQEYRPRISAPGIELTTEELVRRSQVPPEVLLWSHSCQVSNMACGKCRGCVKRFDVLVNLGLL